MQTYQLDPHPNNPPHGVLSIAFSYRWHPYWLTLRFRVEEAGGLVLPPLAGASRADDLWKATCFELFITCEGGGYCEFNLSPSEQWAAYDFAAYREGMRNRQVDIVPRCTMRRGGGMAIFDAAIPASALPQLPATVSASAVILEQGGHKSYWALSHPNPEKPDFHHPDCFTLQLAPPSQP